MVTSIQRKRIWTGIFWLLVIVIQISRRLIIIFTMITTTIVIARDHHEELGTLRVHLVPVIGQMYM